MYNEIINVAYIYYRIISTNVSSHNPNNNLKINDEHSMSKLMTLWLFTMAHFKNLHHTAIDAIPVGNLSQDKQRNGMLSIKFTYIFM